MIQLAIVEDDKLYANQLNEFLKRYEIETGQKFSVRFFSDGEDIVENYKAEHDIILMDIQMKFMNGMIAAQEIRKKDEKVVIIFITSMASYAIKGYEVAALDYVLKPLSYEMFRQKLIRAIEHIQDRDVYYMLIPISNGVQKIQIDKIYYIESQSHIIYYNTMQGTFAGKGRMEDLEKELEQYGFYRSNKGFLVNMNYVDTVQDGCCIIHEDRLPISRRKKNEFMEKLTSIL